MKVKKAQATAVAGGKDTTSGCKDVILRENIIVIASEMHYDSFWWKMMFMATGIAAAQGAGGGARSAHKMTVAYVDVGYTNHEKLALEALKSGGVNLLKVKSKDDLIKHVNTRPEKLQGKCQVKYLVQDMLFFSHGYPGIIDLNYQGSPSIKLDAGAFKSMSKASFVPDGRIFSYACRTGNGSLWESFDNDEACSPETSLAQQMADHFQLEVHAYLTRSDYAMVLRDKSESENIAKTLKEARKTQEGSVIPIPPEHEGLPHPGLADGWTSFGPKKEGTNAYALWRKHAARSMPVAGTTPTGLTRAMRVFKPGK